jgi:hypothetical protein
MTLARLWKLAALLAVVAAVFNAPLGGDAFWPLAEARRLLLTWDWSPVVDDSWAQGPREFLFQPWLASLLFLGVERLAGEAGLFLVCALAWAAGFAWILRDPLGVGGDRGLNASRLFLLVVVPLLSPVISLRTQSLAVPIFVVGWDLLLASERDSSSLRLYWLAPLTALWANLHGSFFLLPALLSFQLFLRVVTRRSWKGWVGPWLGTTLATLAHPLGFRLWSYVFSLVGGSGVRLAEEWRPFALDFGPAAWVFYASLVVSLLFPWKGRSSSSFFERAALVILGAGALASGRNVLWYGLVFARFLPGRAGAYLPKTGASRPSGAARFVALVLLVAVIALFPPLRALWQPSHSRYQDFSPRLVRRAIDDGGPFFGAAHVGAYALWARPGTKVFLDARLEIYGVDIIRDYVLFADARGYDEFLARRPELRAVLADEREHSGLTARLANDARWKLVDREGPSSYWRRIETD